MKVINKLLIIILISISIFLVKAANYRTYGYYWQKPGTIMTTTGSKWRTQFFCINHNKAMDDDGRHIFELTHRENYYSDTNDEFKKKIGYLFHLAQVNGAFQKTTVEGNYTYYSGLGYGSGETYWHPYYHKNKYQIVLWRILRDYANASGSCTGRKSSV